MRKIRVPAEWGKKCERGNKMFNCTSVDDGTVAGFYMVVRSQSRTQNESVITLIRHKVTEKQLKYSSVWPGSNWGIVCKSWTGI